MGSYIHTIISFTQEETGQLKDFSNSFGLIDGFLEMATKQVQPMGFFVEVSGMCFEILPLPNTPSCSLSLG